MSSVKSRHSILGRITFLKFIQDQWWNVAPVEHVDLKGKTLDLWLVIAVSFN